MSSNPIHNIARAIVTQAIASQAATLQLEVLEGRMEVYCHREGVRHPLMTLPGHVSRPIVTRYKLWADVDLLSRRYPLKGRFSLIHGYRHYSIDAVWEGPWPEPRVTMSIMAGEEAQEKDDDEHFR